MPTLRAAKIKGFTVCSTVQQKGRPRNFCADFFGVFNP